MLLQYTGSCVLVMSFSQPRWAGKTLKEGRVRRVDGSR